MLRSRLMREGLVGLFFLCGVILFGGIIFFLKGSNLQNQDYQVKLAFANAGGLREGARVYYRGVAVGRITGIVPNSNGVEVMTEIDGNLKIPQDVKVSTLRSGLLGEVSVNIAPQTELTDADKEIDPNSPECIEQQVVLCHDQQISGKATPDVVESLAGIAERFDNDEFYDMLIQTVENINETTEQMSALTDQVTIVVTKLTEDFDTIVTTTQQVGETAEKFGDTAESLTRTADIAGEQIAILGSEYTNTAAELSLLATNLNQLIEQNSISFGEAIANFSETTEEVNKLVKNTDKLIAQVDPDDVARMTENLSESSENLTKITEDLQELSGELNNPANLVALQQTLDSARVTFANTAKITSDIDEFTGDPEFRDNLRKLIDGLGKLVSYTDSLEKQVELANLLEQVEEISEVEDKTIQQLSTINSLIESTKIVNQPTDESSSSSN